MNLAIVGALIGMLIGLFIGLTEGALTRNPVQAVEVGSFLAAYWVWSLVQIGLPLSEFLFQSVGAGYPGPCAGSGECSAC